MKESTLSSLPDYARDRHYHGKIRSWMEDRVIMPLYRYGETPYGHWIYHHSVRVAALTARLAETLGWPENARRYLYDAVLCHDGGKMAFPSSLWDQERRPTEAEKRRRQEHIDYGAEQAAQCAEATGVPDHPFFGLWRDIALYHHERISGTGPKGLKGADIPYPALLTAVADTFDGDQIFRPHQSGKRDPVTALRRMNNLDNEGKYENAFDPEILAALNTLYQIETA